MARLQTVRSECSSASWMSIALESQYTTLPLTAARMMSRAPCASTAARQSALYGSTPHARASSRMGTCGVATVESGYVPYCISAPPRTVEVKIPFRTESHHRQMRELKVLKQVLLTLHTSSLEINVRRVTDVFTVLPYTVQTRSLNAHRHENTLSTR
jgi:hypothetical protein